MGALCLGIFGSNSLPEIFPQQAIAGAQKSARSFVFFFFFGGGQLSGRAQKVGSKGDG